MKKNDWILAGVIVIAAFVFFVWNLVRVQRTGSYVLVSADKKEFGTYTLKKDQTIVINGTNTLRIEGGMADMQDADCPDKLCVHQRGISKNGESIVCLPNRIVVEIRGGSAGTYDALAGSVK